MIKELSVQRFLALPAQGVPGGHLHVPMGQIPDRRQELDASVSNLAGGILAWSRDVDPRIPVY